MISLVSGVAVGFLLPKILSMTDYGFYKVFTLYAVYTALLHFGFVDGILLKISGLEYESLDPLKMRAYTRFIVTLETLIALVMAVGGCLFAHGEYRFVVIMLAVNMVFVNVTTYYQFVSQAVQRFGEYSAKSIVISVVRIIFVLALLVAHVYGEADVSYRVYLIGLNILDLGILLWYVAIYRDITFGKSESWRAVRGDVVSILKTGILLTLAYQVSHLILALDRQFVNLLFPTDVFAVYSFAYNIVSLVSTMVSSVSVVLLPMLKKRAGDVIVGSYRKSLSTVAVVASGGLLCYFPLAIFVAWFLPEYSGSLPYVAIVLPAFLFTSAVTVVMFTIVKVFDMNLAFFKDGCLILVLGLLCNVLAYVAFKTPMAISCASLLTVMVWFLVSGARLKRRTGVGVRREFGYLTVTAAGFILITRLVQSILWGFALYLGWVVLWTVIFHWGKVAQLRRPRNSTPES